MVVGENTHTRCCNSDYIQSVCAALYNKTEFMVVGETIHTHIHKHTAVTVTTYSQYIVTHRNSDYIQSACAALENKAAFMVVGENTHTHTHCNSDYIQSVCAALYNKAAFMVVGEYTHRTSDHTTQHYTTHTHCSNNDCVLAATTKNCQIKHTAFLALTGPTLST